MERLKVLQWFWFLSHCAHGVLHSKYPKIFKKTKKKTLNCLLVPFLGSLWFLVSWFWTSWEKVFLGWFGWCSWSIFLAFALGLGDLTPPEDWLFGAPLSSMELDSRSRWRLGVALGVTELELESGFLRFQSLIMFYSSVRREAEVG